MVKAYEGSKPYIFVSYSHKNQELVVSVIEALQKDGFRVWFDAGIEAGSEWPEYIASHLRDCSCLLTFISNDFVKSHNCRRELNFAQDLEKPMLNIYIEDVALSDGMRMQLGLNQALWMKNYPKTEDFLQAVCRARLIADCREEPAEAPVPAAAAAAVSAPKPKKLPEPEEELLQDEADLEDDKIYVERTAHPGRKKLLSSVAALIELSYSVVGVAAMSYVTANVKNVWLMILFMILPHLLLSIVNMILFKTLGKPLENLTLHSAGVNCMGWWFLGTIIGVIAGVFYVECVKNIFLRILISIGLNIIPTIVTFFMLMSYGDRKKA